MTPTERKKAYTPPCPWFSWRLWQWKDRWGCVRMDWDRRERRYKPGVWYSPLHEERSGALAAARWMSKYRGGHEHVVARVIEPLEAGCVLPDQVFCNFLLRMVPFGEWNTLMNDILRLSDSDEKVDTGP